MVFQVRAYGPAAEALLANAPCNELGSGTPDEARRAMLSSLSPESLAAPQALADRAMALAAISGLWLRHDFLDESHRISQDIDGATGSFWHGIMHRREGDFANSKYWFRSVGQHPTFPDLLVDARALAGETSANAAVSRCVEREAWHPSEFVDLCQSALDGPATVLSWAKRVQQREWELLFDFCFRQSIGR